MKIIVPLVAAILFFIVIPIGVMALFKLLDVIAIHLHLMPTP